MFGLYVISLAVGAFLGALLLHLYLSFKGQGLLKLKRESKLLLQEAEFEANELKKQLIERAKEDSRRKRSELDLEIKRKKVEFEKMEHVLNKKAESVRERELLLEVETKKLDEKNKFFEEKRLELFIKEERVETSFQRLVEQLEKISHMNRKEAKDALFAILRNQVELENQQWLAKAEEDVRMKAKELGIQILCTAMQRYVADQVVANSSGVVILPNEEIKGKIIGKEGRNIKSLEMATGMEFVIGDTSETITISGFNPIRREIARKALTTLLQDGRINPTRIEEVAAKCESEVQETIEEVGQQVVLEFGFTGVHREIVKLLGMLQFRTSYSQNVLEHSKEAAYFARLIAEELGLNGKIAARCGLLHDIGKALSHEIEGPHAVVGSEFLKRHGESPIVVNAVAAHHEDVAATSVYAIITILADTISASRAGARKETLAAYIKRLEQLEEIANSFEGVKKAYALQAGREIRIIVNEDSLDDAGCLALARAISAKVTQEMTFPGQIKVNVIREKRCIEYAR